MTAHVTVINQLFILFWDIFFTKLSTTAWKKNAETAPIIGARKINNNTSWTFPVNNMATNPPLAKPAPKSPPISE